MKLENIGFYTLSNSRALNTSMNSPLWRCELLVTDKCNFNCPYCRGFKLNYKNGMTFDSMKKVIDLWCDNGLKNIRFSGGEPTLNKNLLPIVNYTRCKDVERIAISTNGSQSLSYYKKLLISGVNDFSISFDACCSLTAQKMSGVNNDDLYKRLIDNIYCLSAETYVTLGVVLTNDNIDELKNIIKIGFDIGVSDIRIITAAQWNKQIDFDIDNTILNSMPILKYRIDNIKKQRNMRGIRDNDSSICKLVLDDMCVVNGYHYPCIIHFREGGNPIGEINKSIEEIREDRNRWMRTHNTHKDSICKKNCLDVCVDYNNCARGMII